MTKFNPSLNASHLVSAPTEEAPLTPEMEDVDPLLSKEFTKRIETLRSYLVLAENPADLVDDNQRRIIFAKLSYGLRKCGEYTSWFRFKLRQSKIEVKKAESYAAVDGIYDFIAEEKNKGRDGKITDKVRDHYKFLNKDVGSNMLHNALVEAMVEQLTTLKLEFIMAISTIKAMAYGVKDEDYIGGATTPVNDDE